MAAISAGFPFALLAFNVKIRTLPLGFENRFPELTEDPDGLPLVSPDNLGELNAPGKKSLAGDSTEDLSAKNTESSPRPCKALKEFEVGRL